MTINQLVFFGSAACVAAAFLLMFFVMWQEHSKWKQKLAGENAKRTTLEQRFSAIIDADVEAKRIVDNALSVAEATTSKAHAEAEGREAESKALVARLVAQISALSNDLTNLRRSYNEKKAIFDRLAREVAIFDERLAFAEMGVYEPHFDFDTSEEFKAAINLVRDRQKSMVSSKTAVVCPIQWTLDGSTAKGKTMTDRSIRLTLRAFNSECDAAMANTRWNNANAMEKRIDNARSQIDKHIASNRIEITTPYFLLKLEELRLTYEHREKTKLERDERAEDTKAAREEQKLIREMERAEEDEARYQRMLEKARNEAASVAGPKLEAYTQQIEILERDLAEAHAKVERARAMAEMTRTGYVYVISNVGSFGPDFVKIGLTRRLEPADRIRELGDASVPFLFDTHAMIYSDDAPGLERALHSAFAGQRVNATNMRKEFFRVSIEDVEVAVKNLAPAAAFFRDIEAQEYRETMALRNQKLAEQEAAHSQIFPATL